MSFTSLLQPVNYDTFHFQDQHPKLTITHTGTSRIFVNECIPLPPYKRMARAMQPTPRVSEETKRCMVDRSLVTIANVLRQLYKNPLLAKRIKKSDCESSFHDYKHLEVADEQTGSPTTFKCTSAQGSNRCNYVKSQDSQLVHSVKAKDTVPQILTRGHKRTLNEIIALTKPSTKRHTKEEEFLTNGTHKRRYSW